MWVVVGNDSDIYVVDAYGENVDNVTNTTATAEENIAWPPDGQWLAYGTSIQSNIHVIRPNGQDARTLTDTPG